MTTTITVAGNVGGTGKTTLIANLAATLATHYQQRVLAVDLSTLNQLLQEFDLDTRSLPYFLDDPLQLGAAGIKQYILEYIPTLHLLPCTCPLTQYLPIYGPQEDGIWLRLKKGFQSLPDSYDFILIDTPPGWDNFTERACGLADVVIVSNGINTNEIKYLDQLFSNLEKIQQEYELPAQQVRIALHRSASRHKYGESYHQRYGTRLLQTVIINSRLVGFQEGKMQPPVIRRPGSHLAKDYTNLAQEILRAVAI